MRDAEFSRFQVMIKGERIDYAIRRKPYRRTMTISVLADQGVIVTAPRLLAETEIHRFVLEKKEWISRKIAQFRSEDEVLASKRYCANQSFLFLGQAYPLKILPQSPCCDPQVSFEGHHWDIRTGQVMGRAHESQVRDLLVGWYQHQARELLPGRIFHYSRLMGIDPKKIGVKSQRRSWGSCSFVNKSINLNWQLVMAPLSVIDYVVVHELAHLLHPNHSKRFWEKVGEFIPDYPLRKKWLRDNRLAMTLPLR